MKKNEESMTRQCYNLNYDYWIIACLTTWKLAVTKKNPKIHARFLANIPTYSIFGFLFSNFSSVHFKRFVIVLPHINKT